MKSIKIILIVAEICCLYGVAFMAFSESMTMNHWIKATYILLFAILAVTFQKEQQMIKWEEEDV